MGGVLTVCVPVDNDDTIGEEEKERMKTTDYYVELVNKTDKERKNKSLDINNYRSRKYDGIVAYLGMLNGMEMMMIELDTGSNDECSIKQKGDPFEKFKGDNISRASNDKVTACLMGTDIDPDFAAAWKGCNNLERKVFMLKYYIFVAPTLMKLDLKDQFPNVRGMSGDDIKSTNALLNGAMQSMFGGMGGDQEEVECKQQ
mmetsp:Transcript_31195/g.27451  ORF Transcript_31195/g.27451 Transcript_31195/m.27451 type:complete len:201 (+) Transcript_31195:62-664(+)